MKKEYIHKILFILYQHMTSIWVILL